MFTLLIRLRKFIVSPAILFLMACNVVAAANVDCSAGWPRADTIVAVPYAVPVSRAILGEGVFAEFQLNELRNADGSLALPTNLADAVCMLHLMIGDRTEEAIRLGLMAFAELRAESSGSFDVEMLNSSISEKLYAVYAHEGLNSRPGVTHLYIEMDRQLKPAIALREYAEIYGFYSDVAIISWVWYSYLGTMGVDQFDSEGFIGNLKAGQSMYGPPITLHAQVCREPIAYDWPTRTSSPFILDIYPQPVVHWGICRSLDSLFYYHVGDWRSQLEPDELEEYPDIQDGWQPAGPYAEEYACGYYSDEAGEVAEYCRRHQSD